jgi:hypothetical protein
VRRQVVEKKMDRKAQCKKRKREKLKNMHLYCLINTVQPWPSSEQQQHGPIAPLFRLLALLIAGSV